MSQIAASRLTPNIDQQKVIIGQIVGIYGVRGWVKVRSFTDPIENILQYRHWQLKLPDAWHKKKLLDGRRQGKGLVARIEGVDDRDVARSLISCDIAIERSDLPRIAKDEYYWTDLVGLEVVTIAGDKLGKVDHLLETGANDVLVVKGEREHCVPYIRGDVIRDIDLAAGLIEVDWDPDF